MEFVQMTNVDKNFYKYMGPFFGSRKVAKELGMPLWDDDDRTWVIVLDKKSVVGFCSFVIHKSQSKVTLKSGYVVDAYRGQGVYDKMFKYRLDLVKKMGIKKAISTTTEKSWGTFERYGFKHTINRGRYRVYEKDLVT